MTSKQRTVIWLGLIIVALNILIKWRTIRGIVFAGASSTAPNNANAPGAGGQPTPQPNASPTPAAVMTL